MSVKGLVFTIVGCPTAFGTPGTASATSGDALWFVPEVILETLEWPTGVLEERAKPLDGDFDVSPISLRVIDDGAASELFTIAAGNNPSSPITSNVAQGATTINVVDGSIFTVLQPAWINRECVLVTAIAGNALTVSRGAYGTQDVAHSIDEGANVRPEVFALPAWLGVQRHAYLWTVEDDDQCTLLWMGVIRRPPLREGNVFALEGDHLLSLIRNSRVLSRYSGTALVGVGGSGVPIADVSLHAGDSFISARTTTNAFRSAREALDELVLNLTYQMTTLYSITGSAFVAARSQSSARVSAGWTGTPDPPRGGALRLIGVGEDGFTALAGQAFGNGTTRVIAFDVEWPPCAYLVFPGLISTQAFFIRSTTRLPGVWDGSDITDDGRITRANRVLRAELNDKWFAIFTSVVLDEANASFDATVTLRRREAATPPLGFFDSGGVITRPALDVALQVTCDCWADGWRSGIIPELSPDTWDDHWDWSAVDTIARQTSAGLQGRRTQFLDASSPIGELLSEDCLISGCTPVTRANGRLSLWPWSIPLNGETPAATFTSASLVGESQPWDLWTDGLANSIKVKAGNATVNVVMSQSIEKYGRARELSVELKGLDAEQTRNLNPVDLKNTLLRRLQLWSEPIYQVTLEVSVDYLHSVFVGDTIEVTDWIAPAGDGSRGLASALAKVYVKALDMDAGLIRLECLLFGRKAYGYAPVCKVDSVVSSKTLAFENNPLGSVSYAGVAGTGLNLFAATNVVELIQRDSTTPLTQTLTIDSITDPNVVFTTDVDLAIRTAITGGAWFSMRPTTFSNASAAHQQYAFVADYTTDLIDGTAERARRIAP